MAVVGPSQVAGTVDGTTSQTAAAASTWNALNMPAQTLTLVGTTAVTTATGLNLASIAAPTITDASACTVTIAASLYIGGPPAAGGSVTLTTALALWVDSGNARFDGRVQIGTSASTTVPAHALNINDPTQTFTAISLYNDNASAANRNWAMLSNAAAFGDWSLMQSTAKDGNPVSAGAAMLYVTAAGSVVLGSQAAVATNATAGFIYIPTCAGAPTGVPTAITGKVAVVYDTTNHKLRIYDASWLGGTTPGAWV